MSTVEYTNGQLDERLWERRAVRAQVITAEPELRCQAAPATTSSNAFSPGIGDDLGLPGTALVPRLAALTAVTGLRELYASDEARPRRRPLIPASGRAGPLSPAWRWRRVRGQLRRPLCESTACWSWALFIVERPGTFIRRASS